MCSASQHFQLVYFNRLAMFSKARDTVIYCVCSLDDRSAPSVQKYVGACEAGLQKTVVRTYSSCTSMIRFLCLDKKVNTAPCTPVQNGAGLGRSQPPPFEKHGQRSEHTGLLQRFASCLHTKWGVRGGGSPLICEIWTTIQTHISSCSPLMDLYCNVFCDVFALRAKCDLQYTYSSTMRKY